MRFTIEPFVGALPLRFEMTPYEVELHIGTPDETEIIWNGDMQECCENLNLGYSCKTGVLDEVIVLAGHQLRARSERILRD